MRCRRLRPRPSAFLLALALMGSLACSEFRVTTTVATGSALSGYRSFAFFDALQGGTGSLDPARQSGLEALLRDGLLARGFVHRAEAPDLVVRYATLAEDLTAQSQFGYMDSGTGWETGFGAGVSMSKPYKKGSLMVDLLDARTRKLVWRGVATGKAALGADASAKTQRAIAKMFRDLTPGR